MVQAIFDGSKTQTRRTRGLEEINKNPDDWHFVGICVTDSGELEATFQNCEEFVRIKCPYGLPTDLFFDKPGDRLYVRENFKIIPPNHIYFQADPENKVTKGWKPSIHMPKAAARIWLEVTDIRVERLQDISKEDAIAEGIEPVADGYKNYMPKLSSTSQFCWPTAYHSFQSLWESINGAESWDLNPWLWVVKFKVLSTTGHPHTPNP